MTPSQRILDQATEWQKKGQDKSRQDIEMEVDFLGSGWQFIKTENGNYWFHISGKKLMASGSWMTVIPWPRSPY